MSEVLDGRPPWLGLQMRHLAALLAVAREGSFRAAADELGYVQSAVSQQLAALERIVGARLVERRRGSAPVRLTAEGRVLLGHFEDVLARMVAARADLKAACDGQGARIRIGLLDAAAACLVAPAVRLLTERGESLEVALVESSDRSEHARLVETGGLEAAVAELPLPPGQFERLGLLSDPYVLLVPAEWPVATSDAAMSAEVLHGLPLIGAGGRRLGARVEDELRMHGVEPKVVLHSALGASAQALVAEGIGAAIAPRSTVAERDDRIVALPLDELVTPRVLVLYWLRERGSEPVLEVFRHAIIEASARAGPALDIPPLRLAS
ncbi:MAG: LysR family transcriptional regulator [Thermoleophilaceae bacterium]